MPLISDRLRAEREALGLSQQALAEKCNVSARSQRNYESGERQPDAGYLAAIAAAGADVRYILTGEREGPPPVVLTGEERLLLDYYRDAPAAMRKAAMAVLLSAGNAPAGQLYQGDGGVQIGSVAGGRVRVGKK